MVVAKGVPGEVLFAYNEKVFGDFATADEIRKVFERISNRAQTAESHALQNSEKPNAERSTAVEAVAAKPAAVEPMAQPAEQGSIRS